MSQQVIQRWQFNPGCQLSWRRWGARYAVYNELSGQTHFFSDLCCVRLLQYLQHWGSCSRAQLDEFLMAEFDDLTPAQLNTLLQQLDELGLIEPNTGDLL